MAVQSGFSMFPEWLRAQRPDPAEVVVYLGLAAHGKFNPATGRYDECRPSIPTLAEEIGLSENTVRKAIRSLLGRGALEAGGKRYDERGSQLPTVYRVVFGMLTPPQDLNQGGSAGEPGVVQPDTPGVVPKSEGNPEPSTQNPLPRPSASPRGTRLPEDWEPDEKTLAWCAETLVPGGRWSAASREFVRREHDKFSDYWKAKAGQGATKRDWDATWRNWMRRAFEGNPAGVVRPVSSPPAPFKTAAERNDDRAARQRVQARLAQELIDAGVDRREAWRRAGEEIDRNGMDSCSTTGYIDGKVIDNGGREVTAT